MGYGRLRVQRVRFVRNLMASVTGSCNGLTCTGGTGGAIMLPDTASATVHACTFDANSAADGAAIAASCGQGKPCSLRVSLSFFKDNRAASSGGADTLAHLRCAFSMTRRVNLMTRKDPQKRRVGHQCRAKIP